jgi:hypothetical protein
VGSDNTVFYAFDLHFGKTTVKNSFGIGAHLSTLVICFLEVSM